MNDRADETVAILAALLLLFTTMLNPLVAALLAVALLLLYAVYRWRGRSGEGS